MGTRMVNVLSDEDRGSGSSMVSFVMYFSSALGTALFAGLFGFGSGGSVSDATGEAFMDGLGTCLAFALVLALAAAVMSWALGRGRGGDAA